MPEVKKATLRRSILGQLGAILAQCPGLPIVKIADGAADNWRFFNEPFSHR